MDTVNKTLESIAKKYNGYVSENGSARCVIRVQASLLKQALEEIYPLGRVDHKSISGQDVTNQFVDNEIRLENAEKARKRYLELLAKAENVEAALLVEKELERLNGLIDMYKGTLQRLQHLNEFSTITINISEKKKPGILGYIGLGLYHSVKWLFVRN